MFKQLKSKRPWFCVIQQEAEFDNSINPEFRFRTNKGENFKDSLKGITK